MASGYLVCRPGLPFIFWMGCHSHPIRWLLGSHLLSHWLLPSSLFKLCFDGGFLICLDYTAAIGPEDSHMTKDSPIRVFPQDFVYSLAVTETTRQKWQVTMKGPESIGWHLSSICSIWWLDSSLGLLVSSLLQEAKGFPKQLHVRFCFCSQES